MTIGQSLRRTLSGFDVASNSWYKRCINTDRIGLDDLQIKCETTALADRKVDRTGPNSLLIPV